MKERIKELRKTLDLTLEEFGNKIGVTKTTISRIENGVNSVTNQMLTSICREFNVNEEWLRTGEGEMFVPLTRSEAIAEFAGSLMKEEDASFKKRLIEALAKLNEQEWEVLEGIARKLTDSDQS
ncbi:helix-turn-helix domain-containing protein [Eisenbergiella porci]|uniref:helix-turn-helix domain-containing protein n=1 Tax=Eisenbergiella porci TaxID=2652274 RepID=UPI002A83B6E9|nr:helix-turn-helix transcriptional regulator [Eisenbergiella porci]